MKGIVILSLCVILVTLISGSIQSVNADHLEPGIGVFHDENSLNTVSTKDSKYQIYIQVEVRNVQDQLISIIESSSGYIIPHEITDNTFNENFGKKEIITIDNIKYEKAHVFFVNIDAKQLMRDISQTSRYVGTWKIDFCDEFVGHEHRCIPVFSINTSFVFITEDDVITNKWTILRELN